MCDVQRKSFLFDEETLACLERQMKRYGIGNQTDVLRFAVRVLDASPMLTYSIPQPQPEGRPAHKPVKSQKA
jgi:hypothetical protein